MAQIKKLASLYSCRTLLPQRDSLILSIFLLQRSMNTENKFILFCWDIPWNEFLSELRSPVRFMDQFKFRSYLQLQKKDNMAKLFQTINLFPYSQFMRIGGKQQLDHTCGGVISLFIFIFMATVLSVKLSGAFSKKTITYSSQNEVSLEPPYTTVSTVQNNPLHEPYMVAFNILQPFACSNSTMEAILYDYTVVGGYGEPNRKETWDKISLEKCTPEHFSVLSNIQNRQAEWGYDNWLCLPLNKTFEFVGSFDLSSYHKSLWVSFNCLTTCSSGTCGHVNVYHVNSIANPDNNTNAFAHRVDKNTLQVNSNWFYEYGINLDETIINTDSSLLPFQDLSTIKGLRGDSMSINGFTQTTLGSGTWLNIQRSSSTTTLNRSYLKLVDVLSYVGGIFPTIFAIFFFVNYFGTYFFEIGFAESYFKRIEAKKYGMSSYIRYLTYKALSFVNCEPKNWVIIQKQEEIKQQVNKFLDFSYLFRRIDFLEKAVSVLFDRHQLKGLHLLHSLTLQQADSDCQAYKLRDRLVSYMHQTRLKKMEECQEAVLPSREGEPLEKESFKSSKKKQMREPSMGASNYRRTQTENSIKKSKVSNLMDRMFGEVKMSSEQQKMMKNEAYLYDEAIKIGEMNDEEIREEDLMSDMQTDLAQLFDEGRRDSDERSRRIYDKIDEWLKDELHSLMQTCQRRGVEAEMERQSDL